MSNKFDSVILEQATEQAILLTDMYYEYSLQNTIDIGTYLVQEAGLQVIDNTIKQTLANLKLKTLDGKEIPILPFAYVPIVLGTSNKANIARRQINQHIREIQTGLYGPSITILARDTKNSIDRFLQVYNNMLGQFKSQNTVVYSRNPRLNRLLSEYADNPRQTLYHSIATTEIKYPLVSTNTEYAIRSLEEQKKQLKQLLISKEIANEYYQAIRELNTSIVSEQAIRSFIGKLFSLLWKAIRPLLQIIWRALKPVLSALWRFIAPTLPVLEKLTLVAVQATAPLRFTWHSMYKIPGFMYLRYGILIGLPLAAGLLGLAGLGDLTQFVTEFKHDILSLLEGSSEAINENIRQFVEQHTSGTVKTFFERIGLPVIGTTITFVLAKFLPFLFGFGSTSYIYLFGILYLPLIHKALAFLNTFEQMRKDLAEALDFTVQAEQARVERARRLRR